MCPVVVVRVFVAKPRVARMFVFLSLLFFRIYRVFHKYDGILRLGWSVRSCT